MDKTICLNKSVLDFMEQQLTPTSLVLEFGSGWSSRWLAQRCRQLVTIETDPKWEDQVRADLLQSGLHNWMVIRVSTKPERFTVEAAVSIAEWLGGEIMVDLVLVDCREDLRTKAAAVGWANLKPGGWLVFDDAQRPRHRETVLWLIHRGGPPEHEFRWQLGDVESARARLALAWCKP